MSIDNQVDQEVKLQIQEVLAGLGDVKLYEHSVHEDDGDVLFMIREGIDKYLIIIPEHEENSKGKFAGQVVQAGSVTVLKCELTHENAEKLRTRFEFTNAKLIGKEDSYGFGDRLGNA